MAADDRSPVLIRPVPAAEVRPLRQLVLRPGRPPGDSVYPGDNDEGTVHLAAFDGGRVAGIASLYREARPGQAVGWRLRGMATDPDRRGRGYGAALLAACEDHVATHGGGELWCNARVGALGFYRQAGFETVGDEFEVAGIGPHYVMTKLVS